jgi:hypothetical protein
MEASCLPKQAPETDDLDGGTLGAFVL